jgi:hypothetical protein
MFFPLPNDADNSKRKYYKGQGWIRLFSRPQNISVFSIKIKLTEIPADITKIYFSISLDRLFDR